jgi:hypothetical protein
MLGSHRRNPASAQLFWVSTDPASVQPGSYKRVWGTVEELEQTQLLLGHSLVQTKSRRTGWLQARRKAAFATDKGR